MKLTNETETSGAEGPTATNEFGTTTSAGGLEELFRFLINEAVPRTADQRNPAGRRRVIDELLRFPERTLAGEKLSKAYRMRHILNRFEPGAEEALVNFVASSYRYASGRLAVDPQFTKSHFGGQFHGLLHGPDNENLSTELFRLANEVKPKWTVDPAPKGEPGNRI